MKITTAFVATAIAVSSIAQAAPISAQSTQLLIRGEAITATPSAGQNALLVTRNVDFNPKGTSLARRNDGTVLQARVLGMPSITGILGRGKDPLQVVNPLPVPIVSGTEADPRIQVFDSRRGSYYPEQEYTAEGRLAHESTKHADFPWHEIWDEDTWIDKWHAKEQMKVDAEHLQGAEKAKAEEKIAANEAVLKSFPDGAQHERWYQVHHLPPAQWTLHDDWNRLVSENTPNWNQLTGEQKRNAVQKFEKERQDVALSRMRMPAPNRQGAN